MTFSKKKIHFNSIFVQNIYCAKYINLIAFYDIFHVSPRSVNAPLINWNCAICTYFKRFQKKCFKNKWKREYARYTQFDTQVSMNQKWTSNGGRYKPFTCPNSSYRSIYRQNFTFLRHFCQMKKPLIKLNIAEKMWTIWRTNYLTCLNAGLESIFLFNFIDLNTVIK